MFHSVSKYLPCAKVIIVQQHENVYHIIYQLLNKQLMSTRGPTTTNNVKQYFLFFTFLLNYQIFTHLYATQNGYYIHCGLHWNYITHLKKLKFIICSTKSVFKTLFLKFTKNTLNKITLKHKKTLLQSYYKIWYYMEIY